MADAEELKSMILGFRVIELQLLLGFAGRNKQGRKVELQQRAIDLLDLKSQSVIWKVRALYKNFQQGVSTSELFSTESEEPASNNKTNNNTTEKENITMHHNNRDASGYLPPSYNHYLSMNMRTTSGAFPSGIYPHPYQSQTGKSSQMHPTHYPIHPDVKLKKLPFYEIKGELLKPSSLVPQGSQRQQDSTFVFHLTPQQANDIGCSKDIRPGKVEFAVQVQVRFCLLETTSEQEDCFPPGVILKVNNKVCSLPPPIPTNKPGVEPKRPPLPVNVTQYIKISPTVGNSIHVQWATDYTRGYVVAAYLVMKKSSEDLLNRLKAKGVRGADYTRGMIKDKLNEDADSEIATTSLRVSLTCPLGKMRMTTPCRASTCQHLQCFDASLYLQMNERKPTWMCPVCDKPALYDKLVIDGYFQDVLQSIKLPTEVHEVQLHNDGSWSSLLTKPEQSNVIDQSDTIALKSDSKIEIDIEEEIVPANKTNTKDSAEPKKSDEIVDLTLSDSDDEPLMPRKKIKITEQAQPKFGDGSTVSSSTRRSPSLIILDEDSPPETPSNNHDNLQTCNNSTNNTTTPFINPQSQYFDLDIEENYPFS